MAGRNTARPLFRRMTSCSCSHSRARSVSLAGSLTSLLSMRSELTAISNLPMVVTASRSVPRLPPGRVESRWSSSRRAAARRNSAVFTNALHSRCSVTCKVSASLPRTARLPPPPPPPSPRPSAAMLRTILLKRSGRAWPWPSSLVAGRQGGDAAWTYRPGPCRERSRAKGR